MNNSASCTPVSRYRCRCWLVLGCGIMFHPVWIAHGAQSSPQKAPISQALDLPTCTPSGQGSGGAWSREVNCADGGEFPTHSARLVAPAVREQDTSGGPRRQQERESARTKSCPSEPASVLFTAAPSLTQIETTSGETDGARGEDRSTITAHTCSHIEGRERRGP